MKTPFKTLLPFLLLLVVGSLPCGCFRSDSAGDAPTVAITTTYLESAVVDLLGDQIRVLRLAEPGSCPGHFDIRPGQAARLRACRLLVRFDFQGAADSLAGAAGGSNACQVIAVQVRGGLCEPESYLSVCRQIAEGLVSCGRLSRQDANTRLNAISLRLESLSRELHDRVDVTGLKGSPVLSSPHQTAFCQWLGFRVVGGVQSTDEAGVRGIQQAIEAGEREKVRWVVANAPEGRRAADALAGRLGAGVIVFENFPSLKRGRVSFDQMLRDNVAALLKACGHG